jgi:hypothetical protein
LGRGRLMARGRYRRSPYAPLASVLAKHPEVARWLKYVRSPESYEPVRRVIVSNPVPGCHVYGLFVVSLREIRWRSLGRPVGDLIVQDFLAYYPGGERRPVLYSGLKRNMSKFCERYRGPKGNGYGCRRRPGASWQCGDHHYRDEQAVGVREGVFRAALNAAVARARRRAIPSDSHAR